MNWHHKRKRKIRQKMVDFFLSYPQSISCHSMLSTVCHPVWFIYKSKGLNDGKEKNNILYKNQ